jgi:hypothetical protein
MKTMFGLLIASSLLTIASPVFAASQDPAPTCESVVQHNRDQAIAIENKSLEKIQQGAQLSDAEIVDMLGQEYALLRAVSGECGGGERLEPPFTSFGK